MPTETALVHLTLDGVDVALPARDAAGAVWLEARAAAPAPEDALDVQVFRRVVGGVPLELPGADLGGLAVVALGGPLDPDSVLVDLGVPDPPALEDPHANTPATHDSQTCNGTLSTPWTPGTRMLCAWSMEFAARTTFSFSCFLACPKRSTLTSSIRVTWRMLFT